ncbi:transposase [Piscirickettsia salmonis]|uniref:transposase n=1 Tax=Piscirickettsia salmonis TaxID=1238 RepID=UPI003CFE0388
MFRGKNNFLIEVPFCRKEGGHFTHSVIVMDNAGFHKRSDMIEAIEEQGHTLEYLPSYSPDLNPIERKWAEAKAIRRKYQCSIEDLFLEHLHYVNL